MEKLITPIKPNEQDFKYYVANEDFFDIIHEIYLAIGHGGRNRMVQELKRKYKNIILACAHNA